MRRLTYHVAIRAAIGIGRVQAWLAKEFRASTGWLELPWQLLALALWCPFRLVFLGLFRVSFALAEGLTLEERE